MIISNKLKLNSKIKKFITFFVNKFLKRPLPFRRHIDTIEIFKPLIVLENNESIINIGIDFNCREYCIIRVFGKGEIQIGNSVFFNSFTTINCFEKIVIGDDTIIGEGVKIYDHNHEYTNGEKLIIQKNKFNTSPVIIGKNCWIGSNVTILKGVTIGDNVIIGAGCLIYKPIPSNTIIKLNQNLTLENLV